MQSVFHPASRRGYRDHGWLKSYHSFSFGDWFDKERMSFGRLRVLNDDLIEPLTGFPMHGHRDMEIITIVNNGAVSHTDSLGNNVKIEAGEVQVMSAGTGVIHSEHNVSMEPLALFQIWIEPAKRDLTPHYAQKSFKDSRAVLTPLVSPAGQEGSLPINQEAWIYKAEVTSGQPLSYPIASLAREAHLTGMSHGLYIFVIDGALTVGGEKLGPRDALGVCEAERVEITSPSRGSALLIEVPMK
jgi:quercetin 2,3-dioxygenase